MYLKVEELTEQSFVTFGCMLGQPASRAPNIVDQISNVWVGFTDLKQIGSKPGKQITYLQVRSRPALFDMIEKHETSAEAFIPLEGTSILLVVPADAVDSSGKPDMCHARAFLMDGSKGVIMHPGTWHAVPYNLTEVASYLVLVDDEIIPKNDIIKCPIEPVEFVFSGQAT
jgi:ureidoglycolate hydrolase